MLVGVGDRYNGLVGTDHGTHGTPYTGVGHVRLLADTDKCTVFIASFLSKDVKLRHPLSSVGEVDGFLGTHSGAVATQGASIFAVLDYPGQVSIA